MCRRHGHPPTGCSQWVVCTGSTGSNAPKTSQILAGPQVDTCVDRTASGLPARAPRWLLALGSSLPRCHGKFRCSRNRTAPIALASTVLRHERFCVYPSQLLHGKRDVLVSTVTCTPSWATIVLTVVLVSSALILAYISSPLLCI